MYKTPITILDFETTGLKSESERVIEVGVLRVENNEVVAQFEALINPEKPINQYVQRLTGINNDDVSSAPKFIDIADQLEEILDDTIMVAHNAKFDVDFLLAELKRMGRHKKLNYLCSVQLSRKVFNEYKSHSLDAIIKRYNLKLDSRHRALDDARYVYELLKIIKKQYTSDVFNNIFEQMIRSR